VYVSNFSQTNPTEFLKGIFEMDPVAAVMIANHWGSESDIVSHLQYTAAHDLVKNQDVVPICRLCEWALLDAEDHEFCDHMLAGGDDVDDDDVYDENYDDDEPVSSQEIYHRARAHFGNDELAREAASQYPGDFM
jgi:hypothetical protein